MQMKEFVVEHEGILVLSGVVDAFLEALGSYRAHGMSVLARHLGIETLSHGPDQSYPVEKLLSGMKEIQEQFGTGFMMRIGHSIYERAVFPPNLTSFGVALAAIDTAYYMNHRNAEGKIGHYRFSSEGARRGRMVCDNPYPCAFDSGIFAGMAAQFGVDARITHVEETVCRNRGALQCSYLLEW
jgi:hypothetical protein